jgi:ferredoxin
MEATVTDRAASITREQLRTFHVAGRGLEFAVPTASLRPAALDQLQQLPPFESADLPSLYTAALTASRNPARKSFLEKIKLARTNLQELLALDALRTPAAASPEYLTAALGNEGSVFFNPGALAAALRQPASARRCMETSRRTRIEGTLATLDEALGEAQRQPPFYSFEGPDSFAAALEFCDRQLARFTEVLRALRTAGLEKEAAFDPAVHPEALNRFDWQSAAAHELLAFPPVVVFETAERLAHASLTSFGRILRSGRPIQVLVTTAGLYADDLSGFVPDFGYLAIAHREAFVLQSSLSRPEHLSEGLEVMSRTLRPAVAVVAVPEAADHDARLASSLLYLSRAFPLYRYDPDRGATWSDCFELLVDEELHVTAADFAAVSPKFRQHFRILPPEAWDDEQMELSEYLKRYTKEPPLAIPFLWVIDPRGASQRAAVSRELVNLCRDRQRAWAIFEELAGEKKAPHVEPAAAPPTDPAAERDPERERKARLEGATQAIYRVVAMLNSPTPGTPTPGTLVSNTPTPNTPTLTAQLEPVSQPVSAAAAPAPPAAEPAPSEDPYIDSFLCTSCNDCFKINPRVFQYDGNKQAFIADARAGTFAELVKAAEGCPARCIHPGLPRSDDATVTPQLLAKAAKLR